MTELNSDLQGEAEGAELVWAGKEEAKGDSLQLLEVMVTQNFSQQY